ncbi:TIGR03086 family metal-binding protein [Nocardia sp. NBC_01499]|uniref:TIGR03086 family metal-binding protein n=1 Tax=Nocardia sp. NBC_01499 TaxID=2903597 RepID=UPI00386C890A
MTASVDDLARASEAVGDLLAAIRPDQWAAPTPCSAWDVRGVVDHLVVVNLTFAAQLGGGPAPELGVDRLGDDPVAAFRTSAATLLDALARTPSDSPGVDRLRLRLADLITHGWDLAKATGIPVQVPAELAEGSLTFLREQLATRPRGAQFAEPKPIDDAAPALDRLAAFAGRTVAPHS